VDPKPAQPERAPVSNENSKQSNAPGIVVAEDRTNNNNNVMTKKSVSKDRTKMEGAFKLKDELEDLQGHRNAARESISKANGKSVSSPKSRKIGFGANPVANSNLGGDGKSEISPAKLPSGVNHTCKTSTIDPGAKKQSKTGTNPPASVQSFSICTPPDLTASPDYDEITTIPTLPPTTSSAFGGKSSAKSAVNTQTSNTHKKSIPIKLAHENDLQGVLKGSVSGGISPANSTSSRVSRTPAAGIANNPFFAKQGGLVATPKNLKKDGREMNADKAFTHDV
jgi:hypothetical protein